MKECRKEFLSMVRFIKDIVTNKELSKKILYDILIVVVFLLGSSIPIYGIDREYLQEWLGTVYKNGINIFSLLSGNSFTSMSIFALGVAPYISASIIVQLLTIIVPKLEDLRKQSQDKIEVYTYILSAILAVIQSFGAALYFYNAGLLQEKNYAYFLLVAAILTFGSVLIISFAKSIDDHGIGKGVSIIMLANILSQLPSSVFYLFLGTVKSLNQLPIFVLCLFGAVSLVLIGIIYLQNAEKRIHIQHAGQTRTMHKMNSVNYIPIKLNLGNVMPVIFTSSLFQMFLIIANYVKNDTLSEIAKYVNMNYWFNVSQPIYNLGIIPYTILIILFSYFYTAFSFDAEEVANNLKKQNIVIVNVRPGELSVNYLKSQLKYLVLIGAVLLTLIVLIPTAVIGFLKVSNFALAGTSLLIINSVIIDLYKDIETEVITKREVDFFE